MTRSRTPYGFTLIELLVVIAIIGLLSSVVLASLNTARAKARDAKRASDLTQVVNAFELYATDHAGTYPAPTAGDGCGGKRPNQCLGDTAIVNALVPAYLPSMPHDPSRENTLYDYMVMTDSGNDKYRLLRWSEAKNSYCNAPTSAYYSNGWNYLPAC